MTRSRSTRGWPIGRDFHPDDVYADPRLLFDINDGRAFINATDQDYDLIVYALMDSLTLASSTPGLRLESFLFTEEAFSQARDHLTDGGVFVMYNLYREPWLVTRLGAMLESQFGHAPLLRLIGEAEAVLAAGPAVAALGDARLIIRCAARDRRRTTRRRDGRLALPLLAVSGKSRRTTSPTSHSCSRLPS